MHPLDGINAKIARSEEGLTALAALVQAFQTDSIKRVKVTWQLENNFTSFVGRAKGFIPAPIQTSIILGEIIHNIRSSLDHLVCRLAEQNGAPVVSSHKFPISKAPEYFKKSVEHGSLAGLSHQAIAAVEAVQPYNNADINTSTLKLINDLSNADKHRLIVIVGGVVALGTKIQIFNETKENMDIANMTPPFQSISNERTVEEIEVFRLNLFRPNPNFWVEVQIEFDLHMQDHAPGYPLIGTVAQLIAYTKHQVAEFSKFF